MATRLNMPQLTPEQRLAPPPVNQRVGLGDVVHHAAKPVVAFIKAFGGPNLGGCGGCKKRQEKLNEILPDIRHPLSRP